MTYFKIKMLTYLAQKIQITLLLAKKIIILKKYSDFTNIFLNKLIVKLHK